MDRKLIIITGDSSIGVHHMIRSLLKANPTLGDGNLMEMARIEWEEKSPLGEKFNENLEAEKPMVTDSLFPLLLTKALERMANYEKIIIRPSFRRIQPKRIWFLRALNWKSWKWRRYLSRQISCWMWVG